MDFLETMWGQTLLGLLVLSNVFAFLTMWFDKRRSSREHHGRRVPEGKMFFMATMFGSVGVYLGMLLFRHKTRKWYFSVGVPLLMLQNIAAVYVLWQILTQV